MKNKKLNIKESFKTKNVRFGAYSAAVTAAVLAAALAVNLAASQLPESVKSVDLSPNDLYSIGSQTEMLLDSLDQDVTVSVLCAEETSDETVNMLLENYKSGSKHINVKYVDPSLNVDAASKYANASENSLVVSCGAKETVIDYYEIYVSDYSSYYTTGQYSTSFDGEGQLTSAISKVISDSAPVAYAVTGHGETQFGSSVESLLSKQNITLKEYNMMTDGDIPEDCSILFINAPTADYSAEEAAKVIEYLKSGGNVYLAAEYTGTSMPNFESVLAAGGIKLEDGIVMEGSGSYYQYPINVIADIEDTEITGELAASGSNILFSAAQGFSEQAAENAAVTPLLTSTSASYLKKPADGQFNTLEKESGDADGPFIYACISAIGSDTASESADEQTEADTEDNTDNSDAEDNADSAAGNLIAVSGISVTDEYITQSLPVANLDFFMDCVTYLCSSDGEMISVSVAPKSLDPQYMTVPALHGMIWMALCIVVVPLAVLVTGAVIWFRRRKK